MFGQLSISQDIGIGATVDINLAPYDRFGPGGGKATLYATAETIDDLLGSLLFGSTSAIDRGAIPVAAAASRVQIPEDWFAEGFGAENDPLTLRIVNTDGTNAAFLWAKLIIS